MRCTRRPTSGLELFVVDGVYRRGGGRDNPVEAAKVVDRVLYHRRHHPDRSLGVVAFSSAQADAIYRELEARAPRRPLSSPACSNDDRLHGFFVKNLENVQGDERDIIIFSVGYGPDEHGKFTMQFGPLNRQGGWRRLNVAITRAKRRVEIVSSVRASGFPAEPAAEGVRHLKQYLDFAERGVPALALDLDESAGDAESPFEEEVLSTVRRWGYDVVPQVGVAGYRIDMAVRHPAKPGSFALGIECDGAMYHSSKTARDRDRLRQSVLEGLGWHLHRIWGPSWYRDRSGQEERLRTAIDDAIAGRIQRSAPARQPEPDPVAVIEEADLDGTPEWASAFRPAAPPNSQATDITSVEARPAMERIIIDIVEAEGPVHEQRVMRAVLGAWGKNRAGALIKESFDKVIARLSRTRIHRSPDGVLSLPDQNEVVVRVPADEDGNRPIRHVPPAERRRALVLATVDARAIDHDQLRQYVARLFGWRRTGAEISGVLDDDIDSLVESGALVKDGTLLRSTGGVDEQVSTSPQTGDLRPGPAKPMGAASDAHDAPPPVEAGSDRRGAPGPFSDRTPPRCRVGDVGQDRARPGAPRFRDARGGGRELLPGRDSLGRWVAAWQREDRARHRRGSGARAREPVRQQRHRCPDRREEGRSPVPPERQAVRARRSPTYDGARHGRAPRCDLRW